MRTITLLALAWVFMFRPARAIDVFFDFESGDSRFAIDGLVDDGAQNGRYANNVGPTNANVPFGNAAALFEEPDDQDGVPPFSTLEISDSLFGDDFSLTLAMHVENKEDALDFTRLFSTFQGTGGLVPERSIFLDYDPSGNTIPGIRAIVNSTVVQTDFVPDGLSDPGYHHFALVIDQGDVAAYFDGEIAVEGFVGTGYRSDVVNIHIGEDPHDGGGSANEQLVGNVDEVLLIERALSSRDIRLIADGNLVSSVVTPAPGELAVYYDFEGDTGSTITDKFTSDGEQNGIANRLVGVDSDGLNAKLGSGSAVMEHPGDENSSVFSQIDLGAVGSLGEQFTLSAVVNVSGGGFPFDGLTRLFSSFGGSGAIGSEELIFDFDPNASVENIGMRLVLPGGESVISDISFSTDENHTLTATYDDGEATLYLDGELVATGDVALGEVDLGETPLKIGEDVGGIVNENFVGVMDDVLILSRALSEEEVATLAQVGAAELLGLTGLMGDFNGDGELDVSDIDMLTIETAGGGNDARFDLNRDSVVDENDISIWIRDIKASWIGDSNLDGLFNTGDLVGVFSVGLYERDVAAVWSQGDWNGDGRFNTSDLVSAFRDGGYENGLRAAAVPEPSSSWVLGLLLFWAGGRRDRAGQSRVQ